MHVYPIRSVCIETIAVSVSQFRTSYGSIISSSDSIIYPKGLECNKKTLAYMPFFVYNDI